MVAPSAPTAAIKYQPSAERFRVAAPATSEGIMIKGFVSVQAPDRDGDLIKSEAFDLDQFMANPQVLVNHSLWTNRQGNRGAVGTVKSIHRVKIKRSDEKGINAIWDVDARKEIDRVPRDAYPGLVQGTEGVYAFIHVTEPDVVKMVEEGKLSSFSWRGKSVPNYSYDPKRQQTFKGYEYIDMWEVSLVTVPNNPHSSFHVVKDAVHSMCFEKQHCQDREGVQALAHRVLGVCKVSEDDENYYAYCEGTSMSEGLQVVKMADGVSLLVQEPPVSSKINGDFLAQFANVISQETEKDADMNDSAATAVAPEATAPPVEDPNTATETSETVEVAEAPTTTEETSVEVAEVTEGAEKSATEMVDNAVTKVMENINPILSTMTDTLKELAGTVATLKEKSVEEPVAAPVPTPAELEIEKSQEVAKELADVRKQLETVSKSVSQATPSHPHREESVAQATPTPVDSSPNNVFNSFFGING